MYAPGGRPNLLGAWGQLIRSQLLDAAARRAGAGQSAAGSAHSISPRLLLLRLFQALFQSFHEIDNLCGSDFWGVLDLASGYLGLNSLHKGLAVFVLVLRRVELFFEHLDEAGCPFQFLLVDLDILKALAGRLS